MPVPLADGALSTVIVSARARLPSLTFQAIIVWRDELNEGKVLLRDIINLEATYADPDAKAMPVPVIGPDGQPIAPLPGVLIPGAPVLRLLRGLTAATRAAAKRLL